MRHEYNKLIRDSIPQQIEAAGKRFALETMDETEFRQALRQKLIEEAQEAAAAPAESLALELADLLEVIETLAAQEGLSLPHIQEQQKQRRKERGGFVQRYKLQWVE